MKTHYSMTPILHHSVRILCPTIVLMLNRNWQAIHVRTPQEAFCMMATNVATALDIEPGNGKTSCGRARP